MKQKDFLFVDIVSSIFMILLLFSNFFSLNYLTHGSIAVSLIISIIIVVCCFFVVDLLKKNKELLYKNKMMHFSSIFVLMFLGLFAISFYLMKHLINVEFNCKDEIKKEAEYKLSQVDSLVNLYKNQSKTDLENLEANLKTKLIGFRKSPKSTELYNELKNAPFYIDEAILSNPNNMIIDDVTSSAISPISLKIANNIKNLDTTITLNTDKQRDIFVNWKRMSLISAYDELNSYVATTQNTVDVMLRQLPINKQTSSLNLDNSKLPLDSPSLLSKKFEPNFWVSFITIIIVHSFILIPFFTKEIIIYTGSKESINLNEERGSKEL
ncbi:MAG: hypothetical protein RL264_1806 [Bacteroidota bacterium]|jgi:hypothetical protein